MDRTTEHTLVQRAKSGDSEAIGLLWDALTPKLYGYVVSLLKNTVVADDVLQDTWYKAVRGIASYKDRNVGFQAWMFAIARNECRMYWRKHKRELLIDEIHDLPDRASTMMAYGTEVGIEVERILGQLSVKDKDILTLRYISELTFEEIGKILCISTLAARVRHHRALARAQKLLERI